tara:strand:+ start:7083 stop:8141 length:1059 start_codon:yes stop_codon:yes gene_type:complete
MKEAQRNPLPSLGRKSPHEMAGDRFPPRNNTDRVSDLEAKVNQQFKSINETLLSLATHIQSLTSETPVKEVIEPPTQKVWNPEKSSMLIWDEHENGISWENLYKGSKAFLICSGPSLNDVDLSLLNKRGVISMAINNSWLKVNPTFWLGFDDPGRFHYQRWYDPSIIKFVPWHQRNKKLYKRVGDEITKTEESPLDVPNCWFLSNTTDFKLDSWFSEKDVNWGGSVEGLAPENGYRVTMFGALRTLYYLGFQEVYLLGCDWAMSNDENDNPYAWEEAKDVGVRRTNNHMYNWIEEVFKKLQPGFDRANFQIYNCNKKSKLSQFPFISYEEAIERCSLPEVVDTEGWYSVPNE